jgi:ATP adenylyltransferase/5',5'''-P-1,P-4-tetraphosphate phosphorylase II
MVDNSVLSYECAFSFFLEFQSQTSPLNPSDLVQAYLLLHAARASGKHLFAFYNCA